MYPVGFVGVKHYKPHKDTTELGKLDENSHKVYIAQRLPLHGQMIPKALRLDIIYRSKKGKGLWFDNLVTSCIWQILVRLHHRVLQKYFAVHSQNQLNIYPQYLLEETLYKKCKMVLAIF